MINDIHSTSYKVLLFLGLTDLLAYDQAHLRDISSQLGLYQRSLGLQWFLSIPTNLDL